jgi:hypothetical protein
MANDPAARQNVKSFAQKMEINDKDGALTFAKAMLKMSKVLASPIIKQLDPGDICICDLPLRDMNVHSGTTRVQATDMLIGQPPFDQAMLTLLADKATRGEYKKFPTPLCMKVEPTVLYTMQLFIIL